MLTHPGSGEAFAFAGAQQVASGAAEAADAFSPLTRIGTGALYLGRIYAKLPQFAGPMLDLAASTAHTGVILGPQDQCVRGPLRNIGAKAGVGLSAAWPARTRQ